MRLIVTILTLLLASAGWGKTYHVNFAGGDDARSGLAPDQAWRHAPGDPQAGGLAKQVKLEPGDVVQFKAGVVYRGEIRPPADGTPQQRIVYRGSGWGEGRAILDGSEPVEGFKPCRNADDAGGNPNYQKLWYTDVAIETPFLANLHELDPTSGRDEFLWTAQSPNPADAFFFDRRDSFHKVKNADLTRTTITAPEVFTSADPEHYKGASVLIWVNPNFTRRYKVTGYEPANHRISFEDIGEGAIYPDRRDQAFAIYNHAHAIDQPGEYFLSEPRADGKRRLVLWPRSDQKLDGRISRSVRKIGFQLVNRKHVEIDGFVVRKFAGAAQDAGCGIATGREGQCSGIVIRNNHVTHNMSGERGYGGIFLSNAADSVVENNLVDWNKAHRGIFLSSVQDIVVRGNTISHPGTTALPVYRGKRVQLLDNDITHVYGTHANGITVYIASENVLVAGNRVLAAGSPITFQDSGPLWFINNIAEGSDKNKVTNEWPNTRRGPWATGRIVLLNNTFANAEKNGALGIGKDSAKGYVVINNILDGIELNADKKAIITRSHNLYTGTSNFQSPRYGWTLADKESVVEDVASLFADDFRLQPTGPAVGAGMDVTQYLPKEVFPEVDFGAMLGKTPNIGATIERPLK